MSFEIPDNNNCETDASTWPSRNPALRNPHPTTSHNRKCRYKDGKIENLPQRTRPMEIRLGITEVGIVPDVGTIVSRRSSSKGNK